MKMKKLIAAAAILAGSVFTAYPCSRIVMQADSLKEKTVMVGRTLDWRTPIPTNLYVYPRGVERVSMPNGPRLEWTSKYGSVLAVSYDGGTTEGMNEKGLVMNGLFCKGSVYPSTETTPAGTPVMSMAVLVNYFLDNFSTVDEVQNWLENNQFAINGATFDGGTVSLLHFGLTDRSGVTLVMEFVGGKLTLHKGYNLTVLTNDPPLNDMQAINNYWQQVGGTNMLPGTVRSADRFVRGSFFINHVPKNVDSKRALGELASIMNNVSVPMGYELPGEPNVSSTQWRSISDLYGLKYHFKFADSENGFYIDLNELLLKPGAPILKLDTTNHDNYYGNVNKYLKKSEGFKPMY